MKSHGYACAPADFVRLLGGPLLFAAAIVGAMHLGARFELLPAPRPTLDTDRTILVHRQKRPARRMMPGFF
jgi:hypothetical protein